MSDSDEEAKKQYFRQKQKEALASSDDDSSSDDEAPANQPDDNMSDDSDESDEVPMHPIGRRPPRGKMIGKSMGSAEDAEKKSKSMVNMFIDSAAIDDDDDEEEDSDDYDQADDDILDERAEAKLAAQTIGEHRALDASRRDEKAGDKVLDSIMNKYVNNEADSEMDTRSVATGRTTSSVRFGRGLVPSATEQLAGLEQFNPTIEDPNIWYVKCRIGEEKNLCMLLIRKCIKCAMQGAPLQIKSVVSPDYLKGYICIEAYKKAHMMAAIEDITALRPGVYNNTLIKKPDMTDILKVGKASVRQELKEGCWVRLKRSVYKDDLAKVDYVEDSSNLVTLRICF